MICFYSAFLLCAHPIMQYPLTTFASSTVTQGTLFACIKSSVFAEAAWEEGIRLWNLFLLRTGTNIPSHPSTENMLVWGSASLGFKTPKQTICLHSGVLTFCSHCLLLQRFYRFVSTFNHFCISYFNPPNYSRFPFPKHF